MKIRTKKTLMGYTKEELVNHCMCLESNLKGMKQSFEVQYINCMNMVNDTSLLNEEYKKATKIASCMGIL